MRVTHVITRLIVGGAQENTVASVLGLMQKSGLELNLISGPASGPEGSLEPLLSAPGLLTIMPEMIRAIHPWKDGRALSRLTKLFRAHRPDIVHTHSGKAGVLGRLAASSARVPIIIHTIHGPSFGSFQNGLANAVFRTAETRAAKCTTHFVVVADAMRQQYLAAGIGRPEQYTKILSGFVLQPFLSATNDPKLREKLGLQRDDIVIGKIARLDKLKGHVDLITIAPELVRCCPKIKFLLIGDGHCRAPLEQRVRSLGLDKHFIFTGLVAPEAVPALVGIMDIVTHLSSREGLPRALPQALAAARPIVAYDCDGAREVCIENETGSLLRPGDMEGLKDRLLRLARNPALRERLGQHGRKLVQERFSVEQMVDALHQLYLRLAANLPTRV